MISLDRETFWSNVLKVIREDKEKVEKEKKE
jgi:hypothetical protein